MPLLVVPLAADEADHLTLREWDSLRAREIVFFEDERHPLADRLRDDGRVTAALEDRPEASNARVAVVLDPGSKRVLELARAGAEVSIGQSHLPDALTAAHGARIARRAARSLLDLVAIMARLRSDDGCPWDREQSHQSLQVHLVEEAYEVLDAIDRGETGADLEEELGDLLLQVLFHAQLAMEDDRFDTDAVARAISGKLLHRHPHVFGDVEVTSAGEVIRNWETIKAAEKHDRTGPFDGMPAALPALALAAKTQKRAARLGFTADEATARTRAEESLADVAERGLGDALFWLVALARARGVDAEGALRQSLARFTASFEHRS